VEGIAKREHSSPENEKPRILSDTGPGYWWPTRPNKLDQ